MFYRIVAIVFLFTITVNESLGELPKLVLKKRSVLEGHSGSIHALAFSHNGMWLASGSGTPREGQLKILDQKTTKCVATVRAHSGPIMCLAYSPDSTLLATGSIDHTIKLWDKDRRSADLKGHTGCVSHLAFNPDGTKLVSASDDRTIRVWDVVKREAVMVLREHGDWVLSVDISSCGKYLASAGKDRRVIIWDFSSGTPLKFRLALDTPSNSIRFLPDTATLLIATGKKVLRWNFLKDNIVEIDAQHVVSCMFVSLDGKLLVVGTVRNSVAITDLATDTIVGRVTVGSHPVSLAVSADGKLLAIGCAAFDTDFRPILPELLIFELDRKRLPGQKP